MKSEWFILYEFPTHFSYIHSFYCSPEEPVEERCVIITSPAHFTDSGLECGSPPPQHSSETASLSEFSDLTLEDLAEFDNDLFELAKEESLRSAPFVSPAKSSTSARQKVAWVVFNGRKTGIFYTWYVFIIHS
jgi:hypothetical protein